MIGQRRRRRHCLRRRTDPAQLERWFLELPEEDRLEKYRWRWQAFERALEPFRESLARAVDSLARAESRLLGAAPPMLTAAERKARIAALAERFVARYWRGRACPSLGGARLPKIAMGAYFGAGADAVHWLDLDAMLVREALGHELADLERRMSARAHDDALNPVLLDDVRDRLIADPVRCMSGPLVQRMRERLTALAHHDASLETRRRAARWLERLDQAIRPDFRARLHRRPLRHRPNARRRALLQRGAAVREEQDNFRAWCAEQDQASLPPALREPSTGSTTALPP